jgi:hypothetical protein
VADDHTVNWEGNRWGVPREEVCAGLRGAHVEIVPIKGQNPPTQSNLNTTRLPITLGGNLGSGQFYLAQNRTFLLCIDSRVREETMRNGWLDTFGT